MVRHLVLSTLLLHALQIAAQVNGNDQAQEQRHQDNRQQNEGGLFFIYINGETYVNQPARG
jgi:hypothetical protein